MSKQLGFLYNQKYCVGCQACETACKLENNVDIGIRYRMVDKKEVEANGRYVDVFLSHACMHCEKPACAEACPVKAYTKREDGIVVQDHEKCIGCGMCVSACPYEAPKLNKDKKKAEKCELCAHLLEKGEEPACVRGCPLKILTVGDISEMDAAGAIKEGREFKVLSINPSIRFVK